ncbi:CcmD family protein [Anaerolineales bacterium HSG6]|nr:CcmD family protein [Anaerolineales bacterium HSG6]MDM8531182.1 CcmD family protein [Anaerolineales bacterium HSG25]
MNEMIYLFAGYAVIWLAAFVFIFSMVSRQQSLQKDVEMLEQLTQQKQDS